MHYSACFRHIDKDFSLEASDAFNWDTVYENEEDFIFALNRMAIASSQHAVVEFPQVEVSAKSARVTIRAIDGQLFYTDLHSPHHKDLKVVPIEIVRLIDGKPFDEVFGHQTEDESHAPPKHLVSGRGGWPMQLVAVLLMCVILAFCAKLIWQEFTYTPRLHAAPQFIPSLSEESEVLRRYADVYVSEYREGAMLFELSRSGQLTRYEMWYSAERNGFVLLPLDTLPVQVGLHGDETALLAGEVHLLTFDATQQITLHGVKFSRHQGDLASIGEVLKPN